MAYANFDNLPLLIGTNKDTTTLPHLSTDGSNKTVSATNVSISESASLSTTQMLGRDSTRDDLRMSGPGQVSLSFNTLLHTGSSAGEQEFCPFDYTGASTNGTTMRLGSNLALSGLYLTSFSLSVTPYAPVSCQCDFVCLTPPATTAAVAASITNNTNAGAKPALNHDSVIHGAYTTLTDGVVNNSTLVESFNYSYSANIMPVYQVGSFSPSVHFQSAEQSLQFQSDGMALHMFATGSGVAPVMALKNMANETLRTITFAGKLVGQSAGVSAGDVARTNYTIVQPLK